MTRRYADIRRTKPAWTWIDTALVLIGSAVASGVFLAILALFLMASPADATWKPQYANADPARAKWFATQHNANGEWCCDQADGHEFYGNYSVDPKDGSVTAYEGGKPYRIEKSKVLTDPNPTGAAVWWFIDFGGGRQTYCFALGPMG